MPIRPLTELAHQAFSAMDKATAARLDIVVQPSVPILYFGDEPAYRSSARKVITVGLNPSLAEFPAAKPWGRFPKAEGRGPDDVEYLDALNEYFQVQPLVRWFNTFRTTLQGLDAGFRGDQPNVALHTDLGTPVATNPTWSKLPTAAKSELMSIGTPLWHDLVRDLRPDVILASVAKRWLDDIDFKLVDGWRDIHVITTNRAKPYRVQACRVRVAEDHTALLVWGQAANTPFGSVSYIDRLSIGASVKAELHA